MKTGLHISWKLTPLLQIMTKLLISLPLSDLAQKYYGSNAPTYNKVGDAGIDLPFISDVNPYDIQVPQTLLRRDFGTVFAMYEFSKVEGFTPTRKFDFTDNLFDTLRIVEEQYNRTHFDIRPRSSIDKTPYRLCNSVGTIDKNYRGVQKEDYHEASYWTGDTLKASLDYHPHFGADSASTAYLSAGDRLLQVTAPALDDILHVRLDFTEENCRFWSEVIGNKNRGGFGSTS